MQLSRHVASIAVLALSTLSTAPVFAIPTAEAAAFLAKARAIVSDLETATPNSQEIAATIDSMLEDAKPVVVAFGEKYTQCSAQLARLIELYPEIDTWTAPEIRRNIEAGVMLPAAEGCYPARDIVAHPAIVRTFARAGIQSQQQARLIREMNEAIEHMEEINADLSQD